MKSAVKSCLYGVGLLSLLAPLASVPARAESLTLIEHANDAVTDVGDKGDSVGDILAFANDLYDQDNKSKVGSDNGYCFRTVVGKAWECSWTSILADGQITVQGPFYDAGDSMVSVIGGTGKYQNARGEMKLHSRNDKGTEYDFVFSLSQ